MVVSVDEFRGPGNLADAAGTPAPLRSFSTHPRRRPRLTAERLTVLHARETAITCRLERMLAVALLHGAIVLFFALGWLLPWQIVHWAVTVGGLAMQACWCLLDDNCPLTLLERRLVRAGDDGTDEDRCFVSRMLSRILNRPVSNRAGNVMTYVVLYSSMSFCIVRLMT